MKCEFIFDNLIFFVLFIANIKVEDYNYYFKLIYTGVIIYNIYGLVCSLKDNWKKNQYKFVFFIVFSLVLYYFSYNYIYDINPQNYAYFYYLFYPNFLKAILIVFYAYIYCF